jgi:hypothetical protein
MVCVITGKPPEQVLLLDGWAFFPSFLLSFSAGPQPRSSWDWWASAFMATIYPLRSPLHRLHLAPTWAVSVMIFTGSAGGILTLPHVGFVPSGGHRRDGA